jgi:pSer/pThr/pTyr-binding forkhead associated (FHA) protein
MPRLVIKQGPGVGRDHALGGGPCVVGRDPAVEFVLDDKLASRRHFRIVPDGGAWFMEDLGSTNGTLLNGQRVERHRLSDGDRIRAGGTELAFVQKDLWAGPVSKAERAAAPGAQRAATPTAERAAAPGAEGAAAPGAPAGPAPVRRRRHIR